MENQWIDICRTGEFTDRYGRDVELTEADFDRMVTQYDPTQNEAPAVVGHPKHNVPAYGWVSELQRKGDRLQARFKNVVHEFAQGVQQRLWPKRSIKFDADMNLIHVGFLGAAPPAVSGLKEIEFSDEQDGTEVEFELADWRMPSVANIFRRIRDWFLTQDGIDLETADSLIPPELITELSDQREEIPEWLRDQVDDLHRRVNQIESEKTNTNEFSGSMGHETIVEETRIQEGQEAQRGAEGTQRSQEETATALTEQQALSGSIPSKQTHEVEKLARQNAELQRRLDEMEFTAFLDSDDMSIRVTPGMRQGTIELFHVLNDVQGDFEFSSAEVTTPVELFKGWLQDLPASIELGETRELSERDEITSDEDEYRAEGERIAKGE